MAARVAAAAFGTPQELAWPARRGRDLTAVHFQAPVTETLAAAAALVELAGMATECASAAMAALEFSAQLPELPRGTAPGAVELEVTAQPAQLVAPVAAALAATATRGGPPTSPRRQELTAQVAAVAAVLVEVLQVAETAPRGGLEFCISAIPFSQP
jgi:hypothetical protein